MLRQARWRLRPPPRNLTQTRISGDSLDSPQLAAFSASTQSLPRAHPIEEVVSAPYSLASKSRFPETETAGGRDRFDYRTFAWCRRHHAYSGIPAGCRGARSSRGGAAGQRFLRRRRAASGWARGWPRSSGYRCAPSLRPARQSLCGSKRSGLARQWLALRRARLDGVAHRRRRGRRIPARHHPRA